MPADRRCDYERQYNSRSYKIGSVKGQNYVATDSCGRKWRLLSGLGDEEGLVILLLLTSSTPDASSFNGAGLVRQFEAAALSASDSRFDV